MQTFLLFLHSVNNNKNTTTISLIKQQKYILAYQHTASNCSCCSIQLSLMQLCAVLLILVHNVILFGFCCFYYFWIVYFNPIHRQHNQQQTNVIIIIIIYKHVANGENDENKIYLKLFSVAKFYYWIYLLYEIYMKYKYLISKIYIRNAYI